MKLLRNGPKLKLAKVTVILAGLGLAGCSSAVIARDAAELENIWDHNVIPKAYPKAFVGSFDRFCLTNISKPEEIPQKLRAADYVQIKASAGFKSFVVDTKLPLVSVKSTPKVTHCFVAAEARTGQSTRVENLIASQYHNAKPVDPRSVGHQVDRAWLLDRDEPTLIYTLRDGSTFDTPRYVLGVVEL